VDSDREALQSAAAVEVLVSITRSGALSEPYANVQPLAFFACRDDVDDRFSCLAFELHERIDVESEGGNGDGPDLVSRD
jgi:hypothetical protein